MVESLLKGGLKLTDDQRQGLYNIVDNAWTTAKEQARNTYTYYNDMALEKGLKQNDITGKLDYLFKEAKDTSNTKGSTYLDEIRARRKALSK